MGDDERRAEVEAVVKVLVESGCGSGWAYPRADRILSAIDRVRDARGDDEAAEITKQLRAILADTLDELNEVKAQAADREVWRRLADEAQQRADDLADRLEMAFRQPLVPARSPQSEDHEAGIEALMKRTQMPRQWVEDLIAAYLSRVSPPRDGTVAAEDVAAWLRTKGKVSLDSRFFFDCNRLADEIENGALAAFSPASTGDQAPETG